MADPNYWLDRRVLAFAHRGGAREGPSNTLGAMRSALAAGATALELDVHATSDRELVVCHDPTVDRTTNGHGAIAGMTLAQVQELDAAWWFVPGEEVSPGRPEQDYPLRGRAPAERDYAIPTLSEVLESFPDVLVNIDIKQTAPVVEPYEATVAYVLADHDRIHDVMVASFNPASMKAFSVLAPTVATAADARTIARIWACSRVGAHATPTSHSAVQVPLRFGGARVLDRWFVAAAHRAGVAVHAWTIDERSDMEMLVAMGVDGIMSDRPSVLAKTLAELGVDWH